MGNLLNKWSGLGASALPPAALVDEQLASYECFVASAFSDLVGRDAAPEEAADAIGRLRAGMPRPTFAENLLRGSESRRYQVACHYERYLRRAPRPDELEFWSGLLLSGKRHEDVIAALVSTSDFVRNSGKNAMDFVQAIFRALLGRAPEATQATHWAELIETSSAQALTLACGIVKSDEFRALEVREWFRRYLRRAPEAPELAHWVGRLKAGLPAEKVQAALVGNEEFLQKAGLDPA